MRKITPVIGDEAITIARELHEDISSIETKKAELEQRLSKEFHDFFHVVDARIKENFERLRKSMGLTQMINPQMDAQYIDHGFVAIEHGVSEDNARPRDIMQKLLGNLTEH